MLKTSKAVVAALLIAGSATTAFAANGNAYRTHRNFEPGYAWQTRGAYAYAPRGYVDRAPTAVYEGGQYVGQDPDPNIRLQLQRETPPQ